jgi:hypothetical protein
MNTSKLRALARTSRQPQQRTYHKDEDSKDRSKTFNNSLLQTSSSCSNNGDGGDNMQFQEQSRELFKVISKC